MFNYFRHPTYQKAEWNKASNGKTFLSLTESFKYSTHSNLWNISITSCCYMVPHQTYYGTTIPSISETYNPMPHMASEAI